MIIILTEFKKFLLRGNVVDLAVGVIIGGAFGKIVTSLVTDIFSPVLSLVMGKVNLQNVFISLDGKRYPSVEAAGTAPLLLIGDFLVSVIDFVIIGFVVFLIVKFIVYISEISAKKPEPEPVTTKTCPFCRTKIDAEATRCPNCTSELAGE